LNQAIRLKNETETEVDAVGEVEDDAFFTDYFFIRSKGSLHKIRFNEITYVQSDRNYSLVHANDRRFAAKISLNNLMHKLPSNEFVRIHQSYIISFDKVDKINVQDETISIGEKNLPLGKTYKSALMKRINRI